MMAYRRNYQAGGTYFFTVNLQDRTSDYLIRYIDILHQCVGQEKKRHPFIINEAVILPEHLHMMWTLPDGDNSYPKRWKAIKINFTKQLKNKSIKLSKNKRGEVNLWQLRYWEHTIKDDKDYQNHASYIHNNPVKHGYVKNAHEWPYSSIHMKRSPDANLGALC